MTNRNSFLKVAGVALSVGSLAFVAVFTYLASAFGYPDILDRDAAEVLPRLLAGGAELRTVWFLYAGLPLAIIVGGVGSGVVLQRGGAGLRALGVAAAVVAGTSMVIGLLRWPTIEWALARHWTAAPPEARIALSALFDASNLFLGNVVGEFVGEMCTALWFLTLATAFRREGRVVVGHLGTGAGILVAVAALRNMTGAVDLVANVNNVTLPLWLFTVGILFVRDGRGLRSRPKTASRSSFQPYHWNRGNAGS